MRWVFVLILVLSMVLIGACNMSTPCAPSEMGIAGNMTPTGYALVGLSPTLSWEYPSLTPSPYPYPSGSSDCSVNGYQVYLVSYLSPYVDLGGSAPGASTNSFVPGGALEPSTLYYWEVRAISSAGLGPWSGRHAFWTGPLCSPTALTAPSAWRPTGTVDTLRPKFNWYVHQSLCMPSSSHFELSTDASFSSLVATFDGDLSPRNMHWQPESDLMDCTQYYWRVATMSGSELGPYSTRTFTTHVGLCPLASFFIPRDAANCRIGPNPLYERSTILSRGAQYPIEALHRVADGVWYKLTISTDLSCWVKDVTGDTVGDLGLLPDDTNYPPLPQNPPPGDDDGGGETAVCPSGQTLSCNFTRFPPVCSCK